VAEGGGYIVIAGARASKRDSAYRLVWSPPAPAAAETGAPSNEAEAEPEPEQGTGVEPTPARASRSESESQGCNTEGKQQWPGAAAVLVAIWMAFGRSVRRVRGPTHWLTRAGA
jgi:hypothetical protein